MPMVVIDLLKAPASIAAQLARRMVEIRPGLFVGSLSTRSVELLWTAITESRAKSAVLVYPAKTEMGIGFRTFGEYRYEIISNFGLPLVRVRTKEKLVKAPEVAKSLI
jgi:CRISPR-associated endoribonuclease Cas2 subtype I-E